jgi:hypothetical protein
MICRPPGQPSGENFPSGANNAGDMALNGRLPEAGALATGRPSMRGFEGKIRKLVVEQESSGCDLCAEAGFDRAGHGNRFAGIVHGSQMACAVLDLWALGRVIQNFASAHQRSARGRVCHGAQGIDQTRARVQINRIQKSLHRHRNEICVAQPPVAVGISELLGFRNEMNRR